LTEEVAVGLKDDICEGKDQAEKHPHIHHFDVGGLGQRVRETNKPCERELYLNKTREFGCILCVLYMVSQKLKPSWSLIELQEKTI
jgi:hypothetical protein